jgi:hypothetical protein
LGIAALGKEIVPVNFPKTLDSVVFCCPVGVPALWSQKQEKRLKLLLVWGK